MTWDENVIYAFAYVAIGTLIGRFLVLIYEICNKKYKKSKIKVTEITAEDYNKGTKWCLIKYPYKTLYEHFVLWLKKIKPDNKFNKGYNLGFKDGFRLGKNAVMEQYKNIIEEANKPIQSYIEKNIKLQKVFNEMLNKFKEQKGQNN